MRIDVGLIAPDGNFYYVTVTNGSIDKTIRVNANGNYTLQFRNNSDVDVELSGYVNYSSYPHPLKILAQYLKKKVKNVKKYGFLMAVIAVLAIIAGCSVNDDMGSTSSNSSAYTHEELTALPADQLLNLFIENGLDINDELKSTFTEDELQELFKAEFETLCIGISSRSDVMYFDLAEQTKAIYDEITQ